MKSISAFIVFFLFALTGVYSQSPSQNIRGQILELETQQSLVGVNVYLEEDSTGLYAASTDDKGKYRIDDVPVGKYTVIFSYIGYREVQLDNVEVSSGKEVILNISMEPEIMEMEGVKISAVRDGEIANDQATVSARQFSVEETNRYAGSRGDPARMASNFAGVQGADDSRNDIVIRGNTPMGVSYQVEGMSIPNPNHFNIAGTSGGPVSILNNKFLANSEFYTGAFPAEFGNSISGVFGLKLRSGNDEKHEFSGQLGFLGTELFAEGPLNKKKGSSYIVGGRYSTFALFESFNIAIGTNAVPNYQDGQFKINFPGQDGSNFSVWGIGGLSDIDILISDETEVSENIFGEDDRDQHFSTNMGVLGLTYVKPLKKDAYLKSTLGFSSTQIKTLHQYVVRHLDPADSTKIIVDSLSDLLRYTFLDRKLSLSNTINRKLNAKNSLRFGLNLDLHFLDFKDSFRNVTRPAQPNFYTWIPRWENTDNPFYIQPFVSWKHKFSDGFSMVAGLHGQYFNTDISIEPRLGFSYLDKKQNTWTAGAGMHSQTMPLYLYHYSLSYDTATNTIAEPHNLDIGFLRSIHSVVGFQRMLMDNLRIKTEVYYQHLYNIPVEERSSAFSILNTGSGFSRIFPDTLVNEGLGKNYGIDITLEKYFANNFLWMVSGSLFDSKYRGSDKIWRSTDFATNYTLNALVSKEFVFKSGKSSLGLGLKGTWIGGKRYGIIDTLASAFNEALVYKDDGFNTKRLPDYLRFDFKINYKINQKRVSHEFALDLGNFTDRENPLGFSYSPNPSTGEIVRLESQLERLPIFYYRIDF